VSGGFRDEKQKRSFPTVPNSLTFGTSKITLQKFPAKKNIKFFGTSINKPLKAFAIK